MTPYLITADPAERDAVEHAWAFILASGHADHGGWTHDSRDPAGYLTCACGEAVMVPVRGDS